VEYDVANVEYFGLYSRQLSALGASGSAITREGNFRHDVRSKSSVPCVAAAVLPLLEPIRAAGCATAVGRSRDLPPAMHQVPWLKRPRGQRQIRRPTPGRLAPREAHALHRQEDAG